jgi:ABC-type dipeptide/oligopeptide/nickel transport system permease component
VGRTAITAIQSVPDFLLALFLIYTLFFIAGIAPPPVGRMGLIRGDVERITGFLLIDSLVTGGFDAFVQAARQLMLPVLALGIFYSAYFAKTARSTLIEALRSDQVEFARACGLPERTVFRYALLQARTPILTYGAILLGALVGGAAIVEIIFSWQGVGQWALEAILQLDMPAIQGFIIAAGVITILVYLVLDIVVMWLDPRVEY